MARTKTLTMDDFHRSWAAACQPHVSEPIEAVALFNPLGAVAGQAAAVAGRSIGGLLGRLASSRVAAAATLAPTLPVPAVVVGVVTATAVHLYEVEPSADAHDLRLVAPWQSCPRRGLHIEVARKVMSERITFTLADGRTFDLDGMFTPRSKERPYQTFVDALC